MSIADYYKNTFRAYATFDNQASFIAPGKAFLKESTMQDPGHLIATYFVLLYTILGPLVLFGIYVLFDYFAKSTRRGEDDGRQKGTAADKEAPALWTEEDINAHLDRF